MSKTPSRRSIFRQAALDRIASQERLDVLNDVTSPPYWIALSAVGVLLIAAILWGIFGSLPVKVHGEGILIRGGEVVGVNSLVTGKIATVSVIPEQIVTVGMEVARLSRDEVARELRQCRDEFSRAKLETAADLQGLQRLLAGLRSREKELVRLERRGIVARKELLALRGEISSIERQINEQQQDLRAREARCESLNGQLKDDAAIRATTAGKVIDVVVRPGDTVQTGTQIITLEPHGPLQATVFVPAEEGKRLQAHMPARISPAHVRPEEHGYMLARVHSRGSFPATPEALKKILRDDGLVQRLGEHGPLFRVVLDLEVDNNSGSGFRWTGTGPKDKIDSGTIATAFVIVDRRRPVSYVIPLVRKALGGG